MNKLFLILALACATAYAQQSKHWAVLVAGSNGWMNYRHQADICHAYQIVLKKGIPPERIITLMYDDIANNKENPTPGVVINHLGGKDVYHGVKIDYKGSEVSPKNFLKILRGEKEAMAGIGSGKVLESGPDDHVFVNFADHGGPGILAFPRQMLHVKDLKAAIMDMHKKKMYKRMVWYVEACESGSMFAEGNLPDNINAFATTAANPHESSYACYFDKERETYLGDVYSVNWMEDSDVAAASETLKQQFDIVKQKTNTSHCQEYGDLTIQTDLVDEYQGEKKSYLFTNRNNMDSTNPNINAVPSQDVELNILRYKYSAAKGVAERQAALSKIRTLLQERQHTSETFSHIVGLAVDENEAMKEDVMTQRLPLRHLSCYKHAVEYLRAVCPRLNIVQNGYGQRNLYMLVNLCEKNVSLEKISDAIWSTVENTDMC